MVDLNSNSNSKPHIVLFPFLAQGHITPFLSLADLLHCRYPSFTITLVSTASNINSLRSSLASTSPLFLHSLPFSPESYGLPSNADSTANIPFQQLITLFQASESLRFGFQDFISTLAGPIHIISDLFFCWTVEIARQFNAFHSVFLASSAYGTAVWFSLWSNVPLGLTPTMDGEFALPEFPDVKIHSSQCTQHVLAADGKDKWSVFLKRQINFHFETDAILINTVEELEQTGLSMFRSWLGIPICPIGPLLRTHDSSPSPSPMNRDSVIKWLDSKPPVSVLYISFGSQFTIQAKQMMELAMGLEDCGRPFIWVVRPPVGIDVKSEFKAEWLPEGFEERMENTGKGLLIRGWARQVEILAHESTGAFLSHCGWNSILESLTHGVPIIAWPLSADQFYNAKMIVEELGLCVELARGNSNTESSKVERECVEKVVEMVMGENEKGREMRNRAREIKEVMKLAWKEDEGSSFKEWKEFFQVVDRRTA